jgi:hypothetical protein
MFNSKCRIYQVRSNQYVYCAMEHLKTLEYTTNNFTYNPFSLFDIFFFK